MAKMQITLPLVLGTIAAFLALDPAGSNKREISVLNDNPTGLKPTASITINNVDHKFCYSSWVIQVCGNEGRVVCVSVQPNELHPFHDGVKQYTFTEFMDMAFGWIGGDPDLNALELAGLNLLSDGQDDQLGQILSIDADMK